MAQLGVLTSEFERASLEGTLDAVAGHGIEAVQFQLGSAVPSIPLRDSLQRGLDVLGEHLSPGLCEDIRGQLAKRGIVMAAVDGTFNMVHPDRTRRWANLGHLRQLIRYCDALGTSVVTLCTGSREDIMWRRHPDNDSPEAMTDLVEVMKAAAQPAGAHGVGLRARSQQRRQLGRAGPSAARRGGVALGQGGHGPGQHLQGRRAAPDAGEADRGLRSAG